MGKWLFFLGQQTPKPNGSKKWSYNRGAAPIGLPSGGLSELGRLMEMVNYYTGQKCCWLVVHLPSSNVA